MSSMQTEQVVALLRGAAAGDLEVVRTVEDGRFLVAHGRDGKKVFFAVFGLHDGRAAELWRFAAPAAPPNASGHTQTDGPPEPDALQNPAEVKALVRRYYESVHLRGDHDRIDDFMAGDRQIRHEPGVRDGVAAFKADLAELTRSRTIDDLVLLVGQGDFVFIVALGTHESEPCAYIDLYRVVSGKLVEHWGFPQAMSPTEAARIQTTLRGQAA